jgi:hypothetical protein
VGQSRLTQGFEMPIVAMPDGARVSFPDDMPADQIRSLILQKFPDAGGRQRTFDFTSPDGKQYTITGPQGSTMAGLAAGTTRSRMTRS